MTAKLSTRNLTKTFSRDGMDVHALANVSIDVDDGEFVSLVGASGCGKTTLLRLVDGLIKPTSGQVLVDGAPVTKPSGSMAFVFQNDGLFPWRTVARNAGLGPELQGVSAPETRQRAAGFLHLVGLGAFGRHYPHELSGGMRQRVNIARALTAGPDVLLMDEPFAALDSQTREIMQAELIRIWQETRKTVLLVTHQIDEAVYLSDRVLIFTTRPGRLKEEVQIDLPRPRDLSIKRTPAFVAKVDYIWRAIEQEVRESLQLEAAALGG